MILDTRQSKSPTRRFARIGYLLRMYPRFSQTFVVNEILELERQGLDLGIMSLRKPTDGLFHESFSRVRARAHYIPETIAEDPGRNFALQWRRLRKSPGRYWRALVMVMRHAGASLIDLVQAGHVLKWAKKHDIVHLHVHFGTNEATVALLVRLLGGPSYSLTLHAFDIFRSNVDRRLLAAKINASAFTVTVSEYNRRFICAEIPGVDGDKIRVNYNGIDLGRFTDTGHSRVARTVFGVSRLVEKKGFRHLVEAVGRLHRDGFALRCTIAGDGPELPALRRMVAEAGLEDVVSLPGAMTQDVVRRHLQRSACFVLPCIEAKDGNIDALPTVLLESIGCGCPTISTRISGIPEIIEDGASGVLVEPGDPAGLADAIRRVLSDSTLAQQLSLAGQQRAEMRFDIRHNVGVMRDWLLEAGASKPVEDARAAGCRVASPVRPASVS